MKIINILWWLIPAFMMTMVTFLSWYSDRSDMQIGLCAISVQIYIVAGLAVETLRDRKDT